jgi:hypothetical protein
MERRVILTDIGDFPTLPHRRLDRQVRPKAIEKAAPSPGTA